MIETVIGLECHARLSTTTKLFCSCAVVDDAPPNTSVCPICLGHPGVLPSPNEAAVQQAVVAAFALGCAVHLVSMFDRKHYFYPDLPKGYQITQDRHPLATGGAVQVGDRAIPLTRIHLEEDTGKSVHTEQGRQVDFNRCGVPLIEIVSTPTLRSGEEALGYVRMLHRVLLTAGVIRGDLEKGHFRCDVNVSVREVGSPLGSRVEVKNINSMRSVARAIAHEDERQRAILSGGGQVQRETRGWTGRATVSLRSKEQTQDYRMLPEPDLPPLHLSEQDLARAREVLPAIPLDRFLLRQDQAALSALQQETGLAEKEARAILSNAEINRFYQTCLDHGGDPRAVSTWMLGEISRRINTGELLSQSKLTPHSLLGLVALLEDGTLSRPLAREIFVELWHHGGEAHLIVRERGLALNVDEAAIRDVIRAIIAQSPRQVQKFQDGNRRLIAYFMGQVMRATSGKVDPALASRLVSEELNRL